MTLRIEFTDGSVKVVYADDACEGRQCLKYVIRCGPDEGEYSIPLCQIRTFKIVR